MVTEGHFSGATFVTYSARQESNTPKLGQRIPAKYLVLIS
jgi:hypothetical protein